MWALLRDSTVGCKQQEGKMKKEEKKIKYFFKKKKHIAMALFFTVLN